MNQTRDEQEYEEEEDDTTLLGTAGLLQDIRSPDNGLLIQTGSKGVPLTLQPLFMGRDSECAILFDSMAVSRFHAVIYRFGQNFVIRDLHSTNGLTINGVKQIQAQIRPGDTITLGDQSLEVLEGKTALEPYAAECAVTFMEIEDYKLLCETYGDFFVKYARSLLDHLQDKILLNQGCPIKNLGDGLMAAFGLWPTVGSVCDKALTFANFTTQFIGKKQVPLPPTRIRIGMAFGEVKVRDETGMDLFGDTVNLSARLKAANRAYGTQILMDERFVVRLQKKRNSIRELDTIRVQGKQQPITIYTFDENLLAASSENDPSTRKLDEKRNSGEYILNYQKGLELYRQKDFTSALPFFTAAAAAGDLPATCLQERIQRIVAGEWPDNFADWQGVWDIEK